MGRCIVDGDDLVRLTEEIDHFTQVLDGLRAEVATPIAAQASDAALLRRLALRIDDARARLHRLSADLAAWHATPPDHAARR